MVSFDRNDRNPFRSAIPLIEEHGFLREIVVATSAVHLSALRRSRSRLDDKALVHALAAKQEAIRLLKRALVHFEPANAHVVLAAIVFFINFELIDTGRGDWKTHMQAAGKLIASIRQQSDDFAAASSSDSLCDAIIADCLTYHIIGSTTSPVDTAMAKIYDGLDMASILRKAELYSFHCSPPELLEIVHSTSRLCREIASKTPGEKHLARAAALMHGATSFKVRDWVEGIPNLSQHDDPEGRITIASAHQAAVRLYILVAIPGATSVYGPVSADALVADIVRHLSSLPIDHMLLKGSVWPTFLAGAQTDDPATREWCIDRLQSVWLSNPWVCPWGYVKTAMQIMRRIWKARDRVVARDKTPMNWVHMLQRFPDNNCLIV